MISLLIAFCLFVSGSLAAQAQALCPEDGAAFAPFYTDKSLFEPAIENEAASPKSPTRLSGIIVPHHLVANHLIARGFQTASGFDYERVIFLLPDHFFKSDTLFATTSRDFETIFGMVETDRDSVSQLLAADASISTSCLFAREHGLQSLLPFLRTYMPGTKIVPLAISLKAKRADWNRLAEALAGIADEKTLIVQSTDFSHYHPHETARQFDQQVLNIIASGNLDEVAQLAQPDHLDSLGSLYVQMKLQADIHDAKPVVIASENQQEYSARRIEETTSYMLVTFGNFDNDIVTHDDKADLIYFAGDTHFGRAMTYALADENSAELVKKAILERTKGKPLVVNLEGVVLPNVPEGLKHLTIAMPQDMTADWLHQLNVKAVGLANNHAMDLGPSGMAETKAALSNAGLLWFENGEQLDIGNITITGLTDLDSNGPPFTSLITPEQMDMVTVTDATRPSVVFVHWGQEYSTKPSPRETYLATEMRLRGASLIIGGHAHVADGALTPLGGGESLMAYSLGNFLFDQKAEVSSGALLEMRVFNQGTYFARLIPLPNLFDLARSQQN